MNIVDIQAICTDCQSDYLFTYREQRFFQEQGWPPPKRCKECRLKRKRRYNQLNNNNEEIAKGPSNRFRGPKAHGGPSQRRYIARRD